MKLTDLEPRWILGNHVFAFLCPHCRDFFLCCKSIPMSQRDQWALFEREFGEYWNECVVPMREDTCWSITGTISSDQQAAFPTDLTVTPSIDASASGCWHGFITNGEIT